MIASYRKIGRKYVSVILFADGHTRQVGSARHLTADMARRYAEYQIGRIDPAKVV